MTAKLCFLRYMAIDTLYISHQYHDWRHWRDIDAHWLSADNLASVVASSVPLDFKTSVEDLGYDNIELAVSAARSVQLVDFDFDQYNHDNFVAHGRLLNALHRRGIGVNWHCNLQQCHNRVGNGAVLWTAGCSMTEARDVEPSQAWSNLLAQALELPVINLAQGGTSVWWSADQIMMSDLQPGDTVVWGLTNVGRVDYAQNWTMQCETVNTYTGLDRDLRYWNLDYFESETQTLFCLRSIQQVINFCNKLGVKLYLANLLDINWMSVCLKQYPRFIELVHKVQHSRAGFVDYAADRVHPGPQQHQLYFEQILNFIEADKHG